MRDIHQIGSVQVVAALHSLLLALADRLEDAPLATARALLAEEWVDEVAAGLVEAAVETGAVISRAEHDLLGAVLATRSWDRELLSALPIVDEEPLVAPADAEVVVGDPDAADAALVAALGRMTDASGAWRVDAPGMGGRTRGVWLVEFESTDGAGLARAAGLLHRCLAGAGVADPVIDAVAVDGWAPPRAFMTRSRGRRLWPVEPAPRLSIARVYDGLDSTRTPFFDSDRLRLEGDRRDRVLRRLRSGTVVLQGQVLLPDIVERVPDSIPNVFLTDGTWVWHQAVTHHLERHAIAPESELLAHVEATAEDPVGQVDEVTVRRALQALREP